MISNVYRSNLELPNFANDAGIRRIEPPSCLFFYLGRSLTFLGGEPGAWKHRYHDGQKSPRYLSLDIDSEGHFFFSSWQPTTIKCHGEVWSSCLGCIPPLIGLPSLRFYAVGSSLFLLSVCFCLCSLFYRDDVLCWLLLARPFLYAFHAHLRFPVDLVWFRLSCDHGWIRSGSVNVRKQQQQQTMIPPNTRFWPFPPWLGDAQKIYTRSNFSLKLKINNVIHHYFRVGNQCAECEKQQQRQQQ